MTLDQTLNNYEKEVLSFFSKYRPIISGERIYELFFEKYNSLDRNMSEIEPIQNALISLSSKGLLLRYQLTEPSTEIDEISNVSSRYNYSLVPKKLGDI